MSEGGTRRAKARQLNPCCTQCGSNTANTGAGSTGQYVYTCTNDDCKYVFQQIPPNNIQAGEQANPKPVNPRQCKTYACRKCGTYPKKGHVCTVNSIDVVLSKKARIHDTQSQQDTLTLIPLNPVSLPALPSTSASCPSSSFTTNGPHSCLLCGKSGTFQAGCEDSLLNCEACHKFNIHILGCLREFTMSWYCPVCILSKGT